MKSILLAAALTGATAISASAQYYSIANQVANALQPALSGSTRYKGFVEASYAKGLGSLNADLVGISTSQGFAYSTWFYMGAGLGVDLLFSHPDKGWGDGWNPNDYHDSTTTGVMIPLFTDFRFNIGNPSTAAFFIDLKVGCSFLVNTDYLRISQGYLTNSEYFYLRPTLGVRIPMNPQNPKQAVNIGVSYQLLATNYWYLNSGNKPLNMLGVNLSYEW
ncbi:MAG: hypothetical protein K2O24_03270 [Muribaculaceae bacterium]|nr:hypothetical protein [Muribaculaceae bacterium]